MKRKTACALLGILAAGLLAGCTEQEPEALSAKPVIYLYPETVTDVAVTLDYGATVPKVAAQIQERVKQQVALMTNLSVAAVNVHVQGIMPEKEPQAALDPDKLFEQEESNGEE